MSIDEYRPACGWLKHYRNKQTIERIKDGATVLLLLTVFALAQTLVITVEAL